jgi:hypothetical protein
MGADLQKPCPKSLYPYCSLARTLSPILNIWINHPVVLSGIKIPLVNLFQASENTT